MCVMCLEQRTKTTTWFWNQTKSKDYNMWQLDVVCSAVLFARIRKLLYFLSQLFIFHFLFSLLMINWLINLTEISKNWVLFASFYFTFDFFLQWLLHCASVHFVFVACCAGMCEQILISRRVCLPVTLNTPTRLAAKADRMVLLRWSGTS